MASPSFISFNLIMKLFLKLFHYFLRNSDNFKRNLEKNIIFGKSKYIVNKMFLKVSKV